ncbi:hypothetical protein C0991_007815, partial [Blastosporella zonata]
TMRRHYTNSGFRDLSTRADQGLRDIDDMRQILDAILQEPESFLQTHKADIASLLRVYFAVVESKTSVMNYSIEEMRHIFPKDQHFPLLSWYYSLPPAGLRMEYEGVLAPSEKAELKLHVYQILAYLRLQLAYPLLSDSPRATSQSSQQGLSKTWFPLSEDIRLCRLFKSGTRTFKPFARGRDSIGNTLFTNTLHSVQPIDPHSPIYDHICRELQPISSLLDVLEAAPTITITVYVKVPPQHPQEHLSRRLMSLSTRVEGPFSSMASILEAIIEDEGTTGGLVELTTTIKSYAAVKTFKSSSSATGSKLSAPLSPNLTRRQCRKGPKSSSSVPSRKS